MLKQTIRVLEDMKIIGGLETDDDEKLEIGERHITKPDQNLRKQMSCC
nr:hypothetical protein [Bacillus pumilus]